MLTCIQETLKLIGRMNLKFWVNGISAVFSGTAHYRSIVMWQIALRNFLFATQFNTRISSDTVIVIPHLYKALHSFIMLAHSLCPLIFQGR